MNMERYYIILLVIGMIITLILFWIDIWFGLMGVIGLIALLMSIYIMQETVDHPDVLADLKDEAKYLEIRNRGNAAAFNIHIAVVPHNIEFDIPSLLVEERYTYTFERMLEEAKVVVTFQNDKGLRYSKTYMLQAFGTSDDDLLKPPFPLFKWKKED